MPLSSCGKFPPRDAWPARRYPKLCQWLLDFTSMSSTGNFSQGVIGFTLNIKARNANCRSRRALIDFFIVNRSGYWSDRVDGHLPYLICISAQLISCTSHVLAEAGSRADDRRSRGERLGESRTTWGSRWPVSDPRTFAADLGGRG